MRGTLRTLEKVIRANLQTQVLCASLDHLADICAHRNGPRSAGSGGPHGSRSRARNTRTRRAPGRPRGARAAPPCHTPERAESDGEIDVATLHRIARKTAIDEVNAAGFERDEEGNLLRNRGDPQTDKAFAGPIGRTPTGSRTAAGSQGNGPPDAETKERTWRRHPRPRPSSPMEPCLTGWRLGASAGGGARMRQFYSCCSLCRVPGLSCGRALGIRVRGASDLPAMTGLGAGWHRCGAQATCGRADHIVGGRAPHDPLDRGGEARHVLDFRFAPRASGRRAVIRDALRQCAWRPTRGDCPRAIRVC